MRQWLSNQISFFTRWLFCAVAIAVAKYKGPKPPPTVLVFDLVEENIFVGGSDESFIKFFLEGPIEPLRNGQRFLIQYSKNVPSINRSEFIYCARPLIRLLVDSPLGIFEKVRLLANHVAFLCSYFYATLQIPQLSLIGKDFAFGNVCRELEARGLIDSIIVTCSSHRYQPLWYRGLNRTKIHMLWYAQNWRPITYLVDQLTSEYPYLRWIRADKHWVWTKSFEKYLQSLHARFGTVQAVGPIMWRLPPANLSAPPIDTVKIVIFDIPPFSNDRAAMNGEISNYNHPDNLFAFLQDLLELKSRLGDVLRRPVKLCLKIKRAYHKNYARKYFDLLERLRVEGKIFLEDSTTDIYDLISSSHLAIVYPYSSPAYVADHLRVSSIFYDPTQSILKSTFADNPSLIHFANTPEDLFNTTVNILRGLCLPIHGDTRVALSSI